MGRSSEPCPLVLEGLKRHLQAAMRARAHLGLFDDALLETAQQPGLSAGSLQGFQTLVACQEGCNVLLGDGCPLLQQGTCSR